MAGVQHQMVETETTTAVPHQHTQSPPPQNPKLPRKQPQASTLTTTEPSPNSMTENTLASSRPPPHFQSMYDSSIFSASLATTTTAKSTTTSGTPIPTDGAECATFFLMELYTGISWIFEWQIIDNIRGETYYSCDTSPDIEVTADTIAPNLDYPDSDIRPFEFHGISGCQYTAGEYNTIETMAYPGVDTISCETDSDANDELECEGVALMILVLTCWW
ncbi:hypothetical protein PEBR_00157 [Penicillium brasilianum]|uniref:Uncharacterized protein n=1 Tax=Penicillium brasilianum TaxID=104259 RepID=A0A1S9S0X3_PENBI|nr:hypothetical protein PEBR_00157 [Penicillium brasilianum]